jgi:hypothetical protein
MAQTISNIESTHVIAELDTYNYTVLKAQMYTVELDMSEQPPSGLSINIQQNGSSKATSTQPTTAQSHIPLRIVMNCAVNDVISVVLSSSNSNDQQLNSIKGILNIHEGAQG